MLLLLLLHAYGEFGIKSKNDERWRLKRRKIRVFAPCLCGAASVSPLLTAIVVEEEQFILCSSFFSPPRKGKRVGETMSLHIIQFPFTFQIRIGTPATVSQQRAKKTTKESWLLTLTSCSDSYKRNILRSTSKEFISGWIATFFLLVSLPGCVFILRCFFSVQVLKWCRKKIKLFHFKYSESMFTLPRFFLYIHLWLSWNAIASLLRTSRTMGERKKSSLVEN